MINFIPIFPLNIVVYPGECLNLHIFEPRYKQLITECHQQNKPFGIPTVIETKVKDYGSVLNVVEISKQYDNGELDIKTKAVKVFKILEYIKEVPDKLYSGAIVNYPDNNENGNPEVMLKLMTAIKELHELLNVFKDFKKTNDEINCYDVAHHIGLSLAEEYELLLLPQERQRQDYLKRHLSKALPMMAGIEQLKEKVKLNGHFKQLRGFDL